MKSIKRVITTVEAKCLNCGGIFEKKRKWHKFCSTKCRVEHWQLEHYGSKKIFDVEKRLAEVEKKVGIN